MTVEELKHALINYNHINQWWEVNNDRIQCIIYDMEDVKGIRFDSEPTNANTDRQKKLIDLIEKKEKLILKNKYYFDVVNEVRDFIEWLDEPYRSIIIDKYLNELSDSKLELKHGYERSSIWHIVNRMIQKYIDVST